MVNATGYSDVDSEEENRTLLCVRSQACDRARRVGRRPPTAE